MPKTLHRGVTRSLPERFSLFCRFYLVGDRGIVAWHSADCITGKIAGVNVRDQAIPEKSKQCAMSAALVTEETDVVKSVMSPDNIGRAIQKSLQCRAHAPARVFVP